MSDLGGTIRERLTIGRLGEGNIRRKASGWWGMMTLIATEGFLFVYLLFSYYFFAVQYGRSWLPDELPEFRLSAPDTAILLLSSVAVWFGERGLRQGSRLRHLLGLAAGVVLGIVFVVIQSMEWMSKPFGISSSSYGSLYFTITGFHMAHVVAGIFILASLTLWSALGYFDRTRSSTVHIGVIYWHFVDAVWLFIFFTIYVTPRLGLG